MRIFKIKGKIQIQELKKKYMIARSNIEENIKVEIKEIGHRHETGIELTRNTGERPYFYSVIKFLVLNNHFYRMCSVSYVYENTCPL
jgi:outer membrane receptor for monomeric catechols